MKTSNQVFQILNTTGNGTIQTEEGELVKVVSKIDPRTNTFVPIITVYDPTTQKQITTTLDFLLEVEKEDYLNSGVIGTKLTAQKPNKP